jgi:HYR domain.
MRQRGPKGGGDATPMARQRFSVVAAAALVLCIAMFSSTSIAAPPPLRVDDPAPVEATGPDGASVSYQVKAFDPISGNPISASCDPGGSGTGTFTVAHVYPLGSTSVMCTATLEDASTVSKGITVTVQDTTPPSVTPPANVSDSATEPSGKAVTYGAATATDLVDGSLTPTCTPSSGSLFPIGTTTVVCTATDSHGNTGSASFTVTVTFADTTAPTFTLVPSPITAEATSAAGAVVAYTISATDNSGATPTTDCAGHGSGSTFPLGVTTVTCTASDAAGNSASASFPVTVRDTTAPQLNLPSNITVEADSSSGKVVEYTASATDAVSGSLSANCGPASGSAFAIGTTTVNCSAADAAGNKADGSFGVTVADTIGPAFSGVPADRQIEANGPAGSIVNYTPPTANDATDGPEVVTCTPESGSTFSLGTTTVTCHASDTRGNTSAASFSVSVVDTTKPTLIVPADRAVYADSPDGLSAQNPYAADFLNQAQAVDSVDPHPRISNDAPVLFTVGVHLVTFTAVDTSGNTVSKGARLTVQPMPPAGTPPLPVPPARTLPKNVTGLRAEAGDGRVRLSWHIPDGVDHVVVTHALSAGGEAQVIYTGGAESFTDLHLVNGLEYRYIVVSIDKDGNSSAGTAITALPKATLLRSPKDGARLRKPPKLVWVRNSEASYYNVQLFRGNVKILSAWPIRATLALKANWKYQGHAHRLMPGAYRWYVWPGFGARAAIDYGEMLGVSTFQIVR